MQSKGKFLFSMLHFFLFICFVVPDPQKFISIIFRIFFFDDFWINEIINLDLQGSRRCRAKIITDVVNGQTAIVNIKGMHNHEVNIKRNKSQAQSIGHGNRTLRNPEMLRISKVQASSGAEYPYQNLVFVEDDDESINV